MLSDKFKIALIGRTNVGKSTLFNRMSGFRDALTFDRAGVTRDVKENTVEICGKQSIIFDTPGMYDYTESDNNQQLMNLYEEHGEKYFTKFKYIILRIFPMSMTDMEVINAESQFKERFMTREFGLNSN